MEHQIVVAGIGPGAPEYIPPAASLQIDQAKVLVGSRRALETFGKNGQKQFAITGDLDSCLRFIDKERKEAEVVVMVSGDPGYYSFLAALRKFFGANALLVIPGISSFQLAFARLAMPWQEARLISLHGRSADAQDLSYQAGRPLAMLTDTLYTTRRIAALLLEQSWPEHTEVHICTRLSYADEEIISTSLAKVETEKNISHCIMVVIG